MAFLFNRSDDALDVLTGPRRDGGAQISVCKAVEATGEDPVEGIHQNLHGVLHGVVKGFGSLITVGFRLLDGGFVFIALGHQVLEQGRHHPFPVFGQAEFALDGRGVVPAFLGSGLGRVDSGGVADVVADHDGRVHALEIEHGNPRVKACFDVVNVAARDLTFLRLSRTGERDGHLLDIGQPNHQRIDQLAGAAVGGGFKRHFRHRRHGFLPSHGLNGVEDVQGKFSVSYAVGHDLVGAVSPFLVHVGSVHVHLVLVLVVGKQQRGDKGQGLAPRPQRLACLPPRVHHDPPRQVPSTVALALGHQRVPISLEFGFESGRSPPTEQRCRSFPTPSPLQHARAVGQTWKVEVVDVVARDDVGVVGLDGGGQALENVDF